VAHHVLDHGIDVRAALVRKGTLADEGLVRIGVEVGHLADVAAQLDQLAQILLRYAVVAHLQLQVGNDADDVGVAAALAVAVDRPLHLRAAVTHRLQRVGHARLAVVVGVDADGNVGELQGARGVGRLLAQYLLEYSVYGLADLPGQTAAVGVAQHDAVGAADDGRLERRERILRVGAIAVEEVLGIVD